VKQCVRYWAGLVQQSGAACAYIREKKWEKEREVRHMELDAQLREWKMREAVREFLNT